MTEAQLRQKVVDIANSWVGRKEGSTGHKEILSIYNSHSPLPRRYKMQMKDPWCAATVSAIFVKAGLTDIGFPECSCSKMIELYKAKGRWKEADSYTPSPADLVMYDWGDGKNYATTDNTGAPDHVGMVVSVSGSTIKVVEGNFDGNPDSVDIRSLQVNGRYIRGYCLPDYASKAVGASTSDSKSQVTSDPSAAKKPPTALKTDPARAWDSAYGSAKGKVYTVTASALNMRVGASTGKKIIKSLPKGSKVTCYGYYTQNGSSIWLLVKDSTGTVGFCSKKYLK